MIDPSRILVRATNWVGDAVMSLPALRAIRTRYPGAHIAIQARPWVADIYAREPFCNEIILHTAGRGRQDFLGKWRLAQQLRTRSFDCAILLQNAFEAALIAWMARIPVRVGYKRDGRGLLLTHAIPLPPKGSLPPHESFYYLELLRCSGIISELPADEPIRLVGAARPAENLIGVSPGAAYGTAKRWLPERFAEAAAALAHELGAPVALFGSADERALCESIAGAIATQGIGVTNYAGETTLRQFIDLAAVCRVFLTNDSGAMHIASALGVPTIAVFGATDHIATGPHGPQARVVREPVECSPCLLRECPIDHRCMTRVSSERVVHTALELLR